MLGVNAVRNFIGDTGEVAVTHDCQCRIGSPAKPEAATPLGSPGTHMLFNYVENLEVVRSKMTGPTGKVRKHFTVGTEPLSLNHTTENTDYWWEHQSTGALTCRERHSENQQLQVIFRHVQGKIRHNILNSEERKLMER